MLTHPVQSSKDFEKIGVKVTGHFRGFWKNFSRCCSNLYGSVAKVCSKKQILKLCSLAGGREGVDAVKQTVPAGASAIATTPATAGQLTMYLRDVSFKNRLGCGR